MQQEHSNSAGGFLPARIGNAVSTLSYNGVEIRVRAETLSLTDMWKAAGEPENKNPAQWTRSAGAAEFIDHVALIVGNSHNNLIDARKRAGTWAHWQIGLAYAKYLSPEFHMWANSVVRERMEGRGGRSIVPADVVEQIDRTFGIVRMLAHKVTEIERVVTTVDEIVEAKIAADPRVAVLNYVSVNQILAEQFKVPPKGRRSIRQKVFRRLQDHCLASGIKAFKSAHSGTWLFPPHEAIAFVKDHCGSLIGEHMARLKGQGVLHFPNKSR